MWLTAGERVTVSALLLCLSTRTVWTHRLYALVCRLSFVLGLSNFSVSEWWNVCLNISLNLEVRWPIRVLSTIFSQVNDLLATFKSAVAASDAFLAVGIKTCQIPEVIFLRKLANTISQKEAFVIIFWQKKHLNASIVPPQRWASQELKKSTTFLFDNQYVQQPQHDEMKSTLLNNYSVKSISLWENHYLFAFYFPKSVVSAIPAVRKHWRQTDFSRWIFFRHLMLLKCI